jgi:hypothetical protein
MSKWRNFAQSGRPVPQQTGANLCMDVALSILQLCDPGLPDFSWCMIPKPAKSVPNDQKMYQMVIKYPEGL